jgi:hypothetical protein
MVQNKKNMRTKRNKRLRKKNKSYKIYGGSENVINKDIDRKDIDRKDIDRKDIDRRDIDRSDDLTEQIKAQHSLSNFLPDFGLSNFGLSNLNLGESKVLNKLNDLSESLAVKAIDKSAEYFNVDLKNSEQLQERLEDLKKVFDDPKNKELIGEISANLSEVGVVALTAASPFITKLLEETSEKVKLIGSEFGETGVKVALNTLGEIPGYGVIVGTVRSANNIGEAVLASTNATAEVVTTASDTLNASMQSFDKLLKEKGDLIDRTTDSINKFSENMKHMPEQQSGGGRGGLSRRYKKDKNKTKRVRFNL